MKFKVKKEVRLGFLIVISLLLLFWGINYLKGIDVFHKQTEYIAIYDEVEGLRETNPVQINGFIVGQVREIWFLPDNSGRIAVRIKLTPQAVQLPKNTVAKIKSLDLLGSKSINLILGNEVDNYHKPGDTLRSSVEASLSEEVNRQILPLKMKAEDLLSSMDTLVGVVQTILNKKAQENLSASFESIKGALATFEIVALRADTMISTEKQKLSQIMINFQSISNNLRNNNENITSILDNVAYITDSIAMSDITSTINNAGIAFSNAADIMEKINKGEGSVGQLVNNDSLYFHLENASLSLDRLLIDMEKNPGRYVHVSVFGGKDKEDKRREKEKKKLDRQQKKKDSQ